MDDFLLREAEHKEAVARELEASSEPSVLREAARQRSDAAELRDEWQRRQPMPSAPPAPKASPSEASAKEGPSDRAESSSSEDTDTAETAMLRQVIVDAIKSCYDPEIPVNIYDLGLIYRIGITPAGAVDLDMTLTAPGCPAAGILPGEVEGKVRSIPGVTEVQLNLVWQPPWDQSKMSPAARLQLGIDW